MEAGNTPVQRSSNVKEELAQRAIFGLVPGLIALAIGIIILAYRSQTAVGLGWVLVLAGLAGVGYGVKQLLQIRKITEISVICPFCNEANEFTVQPDDDIRCNGCQREIPFAEGRLLQVFQVQCGKCSSLNYYSEKSTGLICEFCDSVIPISSEEGPEAAQTFEHFTARDPGQPVDIYLTDAGPHREKMIEVLQKMLALNRNQVKEIIEEVPSLLLIGIAAKKAEYLARDIHEAGGQARIDTSGS